jgi:hypothetical protein
MNPITRKHPVTGHFSLCRYLLIAVLTLPGVSWAAILTVETSADVIADDGDCSLREAIINANNNDQSGSTDCPAGEAAPGTIDEIVFDAGTNNTPIVLTLTGTGENAAATGDLDVTDSLMITGNGAASATVLDGNGTDRVFEVRDDAHLQLFSLAVTNGGGVNDGGGIYVFTGRLDMTDASVHSNVLSAGPGLVTLEGAGIRALDTLQLTRVRVEGNRMQGTGDARGRGAGIFVGPNVSILVEDSLISDNTINTVDGFASGAGVYNNPANGAISSSILGSILSGNEANTTGEGGADGGAINHQAGTLTLSKVLLSDNVVSRSSAAGSSLASGGAMVAFAPVQIVNTTVSGNRSEAVDSARVAGLSLSGGGTVNNVTITNNRVVADAGGSALGGGMSGTGALDVSNTIIAGNSSTGNSPDCSGVFTSAGYNLIGDNSNCTFTTTTGDQVGDVAGGDPAINPRLTDLANNGGSITIDGATFVMRSNAPRTNSPAVDAGDPNPPGGGGTCLTTDQRGEARPADGDGDGAAVCDIGAIEDAVVRAASSGGGGGGAPFALMPWLVVLLLRVGRRQ